MALVSQEPVLFARTVEENITYGLSDAPVAAVMEAAVQANAHEFISELPEGYQTSTRQKKTLENTDLTRLPPAEGSRALLLILRCRRERHPPLRRPEAEGGHRQGARA